MTRSTRRTTPYRWPLFTILTGALILVITATVDPFRSPNARTAGSLLVLGGVAVTLYRVGQSRTRRRPVRGDVSDSVGPT